MAFNLRNRHFLKEIDFTPQECRFLLAMSAEIKRSKYAGYEEPRLAGKNIAADLREDLDAHACAFEVAAHDQGAHVTYLGPAGSQLGHKEIGEGHGARARPDVRRDRVSRLRPGRRRDACRVRGRAGVERPHRPVAPDADARRHADDARAQRRSTTDEIGFCFLGDARNNMAQLVARRRGDDGHGRAHRRPAVAVDPRRRGRTRRTASPRTRARAS